jgi:hypothetical protein
MIKQAGFDSTTRASDSVQRAGFQPERLAHRFHAHAMYVEAITPLDLEPDGILRNSMLINDVATK